MTLSYLSNPISLRQPNPMSGARQSSLFFPVPPPALERQASRDPAQAEVNQARILIVEDNEILCQGLQLLLEVDGFRVQTAGNGVEALQKMHPIAPDLIVSDISMPKMNGYELFEAVRANAEWVVIPFIFLTARATREEIFRGKGLGAEDYLVKPINRQELITTIRSRLARSQQLLMAQLQQAYELSLVMLSEAIELRDHYTRRHVEHVRDITEVLSIQMGCSPAQVAAFRFGSILHDIGKIYIRESVLLKPGPLSPDEWVEMKRHPVSGANLVKNIPYLTPAIPIIRHHHERWNGQGYPDGLAGPRIPLGARIVAVADSLDAMMKGRVYQRARAPEQAYAEIVTRSGSLYDPEVVRAFQGSWDTILKRMSTLDS